MVSNEKMNQLINQIIPFLEKNEKVISCGTFVTKGPIGNIDQTMGFSDLSNRNHLIGCAGKRIIVLALDRKTSLPISKEVYTIPYSDVKVTEDALLIKRPEINRVTKYFFSFGYKVKKEQFSIFFPGFLEVIEQGQKDPDMNS